MTLGNIFEEDTRDSGGLIFVDKDTNVKCYHDDIAELIQVAVCSVSYGLTMNEVCQALQRLADI